MKSHITVTTSWDDGHTLDLKLADLLERHGLPGTFYIAPENREFAPADRLTAAQITALGERFEIGAHTITHPRLPQVSEADGNTEIAGSKTMLEAMLGRPVTTFCYPGGAYTAANVRQAQAAGYRYARTVERFATTVGTDPFTAPTTLHTYRHWSDAWRIAQFAHFHPAHTLRYLLNWDQLAIAMFDQVASVGGVFHLWGHSWEIEANGDWNRLDAVLQHIGRRPAVRYVANGDLV